MAAKKKASKRDEALAWFGNLSARITGATVPELQQLIAEAREGYRLNLD